MLELEDFLPPPQSLEWPEQIVFDVDSTLWPFEEVAPRLVGINPVLFQQTYIFRENPNLTQMQVALLLRLAGNPLLFEQMELFPGAADITRVQELGLEVVVNSNCQSRSVIPVKRRKLLDQIPELNPDLIFLNNLAGGHDRPKVLSDHTLILVEDSPFNVAESIAKVNILRKIPWNQSAEAKEIMHGKTVISFDTIEEINKYIYTGIRNWQKAYNFTPPA